MTDAMKEFYGRVAAGEICQVCGQKLFTAENARLRAALKVAKEAILRGGWNDAQRDIIEAAIEIQG